MTGSVVSRRDQDRSSSLAASAEEAMAEEPMAEDPMAEDPMADPMAVVSWARFLDLNAMEPALETLLLEVVEA